jgi:hypothetical protein
MPLTTEQRRHLEKRLRDERARALQLLNGIVAERLEIIPWARTCD